MCGKSLLQLRISVNAEIAQDYPLDCGTGDGHRKGDCPHSFLVGRAGGS